MAQPDATFPIVSQGILVKRQFGHRARLVLSPVEVLTTDNQAHAARTLWNLLHAWWQMMPKERRTLSPNFKGRLRAVMSVDIPQGRDLNIVRVHRRWGQVNIPKVGRVRFRWTKDLPVGRHASAENRITGARLVKDALGWHITFRVQTLQATPPPHQGPDVGIDVGVTVPLALSDGETYEHGQWLTPKEKAKLLRLEQRAARRKQHRRPGERSSRRLQRTYDQIAGLRAKAKRRALDWQHRTTTAIAEKYGTVVIEALTIPNMVRSARGTVEEPGKNVAQKSGLNRSISQEAWGRTVTMLTYKIAQRGGILHKVPAPAARWGELRPGAVRWGCCVRAARWGCCARRRTSVNQVGPPNLGVRAAPGAARWGCCGGLAGGVS